MKVKAKSLVSLLLAVCMVLTLSLGLTGCGSAKATTPRLRINPENNYWEVSYDDGSTWESMNVAATGVAGKDGKDGVNGKDGANGLNGANGKTVSTALTVPMAKTAPTALTAPTVPMA